MPNHVRASNYGPLIAALLLVLVVIAFSLASDRFLIGFNLESVLSRAAPLALVALGATLVLAAGEIDVSVAAVAALSGVVFMRVVESGSAVAWLAVVGVGVVVGAINAGLLQAGINSFIATLATLFAASGVAFALSHGRPVRGEVIELTISFEQSWVWWITPRVAIALGAAIVLYALLAHSTAGRRVMAVGGDARVARLNGIGAAAPRLLVFTISGVLSAIAGVITAIGLSSASPVANADLLLGAIAAAIIGGARLSGGEGSIVGTVIAVLALAAVGNGMNLLNVTPYGQTIVSGSILLLAVAVDAALELRKKGRLRLIKPRPLRTRGGAA